MSSIVLLSLINRANFLLLTLAPQVPLVSEFHQSFINKIVLVFKVSKQFWDSSISFICL